VIDAVLERAGITDCFAVTVSGEEVAAGKPARDVYLATARRLGVNPADAAAVKAAAAACRPFAEWAGATSTLGAAGELLCS
jgi:beta-phosphoglucomutase-like phosphatase (HAD superfamily)